MPISYKCWPDDCSMLIIENYYKQKFSITLLKVCTELYISSSELLKKNMIFQRLVFKILDVQNKFNFDYFGR